MSKSMLATAAEPNQVQAISGTGPVFLVAALLVLILGTGLRVYHLGQRSLWFDEAVTANISRGTQTQVLEQTRLVSAPVLHPYILYIAEKFDRGAVAARVPSVLASLLAVVLMLAMVRAHVSPKAALFAAAIIAVSPTQIRYAQEVREYSLSVLVAAILIYCFLRWEATGSRSHHPVLLYAVLLVAPLTQYGLVFLALAILSTMILRVWFDRDTPFRLLHVAIASAALIAGGVLSFALTLRYQFHSGATPWYLVDEYFDPTKISLVKFVYTNTAGLLAFLIPLHLIRLSFVAAAIFFSIAQAIKRRWHSITLLAFTSFAIVLCASIARVYPYGGVRQCLFLAPVVILFAGITFSELLQLLERSAQQAAAVVLLLVIMVSGYRSVVNSWPYAEFEDTSTILKELARSSLPNDQIWVNHDAVPAFEFYLPKQDPRFTYGTYHEDTSLYIPDLSGSIHRQTNRIWLVFSHLTQARDRAEQQLIVKSLSSEWNVQRVIAPTNTELYLAYRKASL